MELRFGYLQLLGVNFNLRGIPIVYQYDAKTKPSCLGFWLI